MIVLCLARLNAVEEWKRLMGPENFSTARISAPTSLQALYGDRDIETKNAVYGSQSVDDVGRELRFFFPNSKRKFPGNNSHLTQCPFLRTVILEPINFVDDYLSANIHQPLTDALYEMIKTKPDEPLVWLANYMLEHNSNKPIIHQADPDTMQLLMGLKDKGKSAKMTLKNDGAPENCGCYLTAASSVTSPATAHWCTKLNRLKVFIVEAFSIRNNLIECCSNL